MLTEFKKFILRGNVVDMAVGIVIGAAFGAIVQSLVDDILMPPISYLLGGQQFDNLFIALGPGSYATLAEAQEAGAATINYGLFLNKILFFPDRGSGHVPGDQGHQPPAGRQGKRRGPSRPFDAGLSRMPVRDSHQRPPLCLLHG